MNDSSFCLSVVRRDIVVQYERPDNQIKIDKNTCDIRGGLTIFFGPGTVWLILPMNSRNRK